MPVSGMRFHTVSSDDDIRQILRLQAANLPKNISADTLATQGFVTVEHDFDTLQRMNAAEPSVIMKDGGTLAGYALSMTRSFGTAIPVLLPMFDLFKKMEYKGRRLEDYAYIVVGQVCVADGYRGRGLFDQLYQAYRATLSGRYDLAVTEIAQRNLRSIAAHRRTGFDTAHQYQAPDGEWWDVVVWDWRDKL
jgi:hypothetical protein